ncbi:F-box only protein 39-like [Acipenser oxyrinchus oxyrinchus]|uniref:F-box only protein 39 n=1 Tax=Acipenser oxyrinchus oxyrinchus TaxID=40147 RepID=A0AAD8CVD9_ACIOX|nr:F-box only protein 39-like [Acipenser oxyrinchus oxyrinchus]
MADFLPAVRKLLELITRPFADLKRSKIRMDAAASTSTSDALDEPEDFTWAYLPDVCLRRVFRFLPDRDRARAALVCRHWNRIMYSPDLWRFRSFSFSGRYSKSRRSEFESAVWYAKKFGSYLENLEIKYTNPHNSLVSKRFQAAMRTFLAVLRKDNSRLRSFTISYLELDRAAWSQSVRNALLKSLCLFLRRESRHLEYLNFKGARVSLPQGCTLLSSVGHAERNSSISELNIEDFFCMPIAAHAHTLFSQTLARFQNLSKLSLNYACISDEVLETLAASCASTLRTLNVKCHVHEPHSQVVWGFSWAKLASRSSDLRVNFYFEGLMKSDRLSRILLPEIPVRSLSLTNCYFGDADWTVKPTLVELLPNYKASLQRLTLDFNNSHESIDNELLGLILLCSKLYYLKIWAFLEVRFIEALLQNRQENKCVFRTLKVRIYTQRYETNEEDSLLQQVQSQYRELIDNELNYFVIPYPMM